ncbi:hypothetical protein BOTCAL_0332g00090 [Botryotinia calthae]|uniref:Uncharacterized protein n=1 Tax=Botryotinia calthae TaxID=38488 RepID=A0A4Y8CT52_9HELO|nr:hypothetical protein BOTCAL_0332g00090 [Botryotinia calthae]
MPEDVMGSKALFRDISDTPVISTVVSNKKKVAVVAGSRSRSSGRGKVDGICTVSRPHGKEESRR